MKKIDSIVLSGKESLPLIEGGKGIAISSGESSGAWAKAGGVGTFSGVNAAILGTIVKNNVTDVGEPSYTSGAHIWKGTADILNAKPTKIKTIPKVRAYSFVSNWVEITLKFVEPVKP